MVQTCRHTHTHRHTHTDTHTRTHTITCVPGLLLLVLAGMTGFFLHETEGNSGSFWCQPGTWSYRSDNGNIVTPCTTSVTLAHKSVVYISFTGHASVETGSCYGSASVGHQRTVCVCACVHAHNRKTHTSGHLSVSCPTYVSVCLSACLLAPSARLMVTLLRCWMTLAITPTCSPFPLAIRTRQTGRCFKMGARLCSTQAHMTLACSLLAPTPDSSMALGCRGITSAMGSRECTAAYHPAPSYAPS